MKKCRGERWQISLHKEQLHSAATNESPRPTSQKDNIKNRETAGGFGVERPKKKHRNASKKNMVKLALELGETVKKCD
jgi:hypothetical protein